MRRLMWILLALILVGHGWVALQVDPVGQAVVTFLQAVAFVLWVAAYRRPPRY